jgi:hypothetical protein
MARVVEMGDIRKVRAKIYRRATVLGSLQDSSGEARGYIRGLEYALDAIDTLI